MLHTIFGETLKPQTVTTEELKKMHFIEAVDYLPNLQQDLSLIHRFTQNKKTQYQAHILVHTTTGTYKVSTHIHRRNSQGIVIDQQILIPFYSLVGIHFEF